MPSPQQVFEALTKGLPHFPDGRINFTGVRKAPVINVIVEHKNHILILKRSHKVSAYQGLWNGVSGFIDRSDSIEAFARQELHEELALPDEVVATIQVCTPYEVVDTSIDRTWVVYPVGVALRKRPAIVLDWEHTAYKWIKPSTLSQYKHVKDLDISIEKALTALQIT